MTIEAQFSLYRSCYYLPEVLNHIISKVHGFIRLILLTVLPISPLWPRRKKSAFTTLQPSRVWSDEGGEVQISSQNREDVYEHVLDLFYQLFTSLEEHLRIFNPDNKSIFMVCTRSSVHKYSATCTLSEMLSTVMVLELRINQHKNCGEDAEIKGGSSAF